MAMAAAQILALLSETPRRIEAFTAGMSEQQLHAGPEPGEWSVNEVLAHLRSCADIWGDGIRTIIDEDRPTIRAVSPRTWIKRTKYPELQFRPSLRAFAAQRTELLALLPEKSAAWERTATVTGAGAPVDKSVLYYAERMARHERVHLAQVKNILDATS
jgi:hypothetical protein